MPYSPLKSRLFVATICAWLALPCSLKVFAAQSLPGKITVDKMYLESEVGSDPIMSLAIDSQGFLWFSGRSGVQRYNGYTLKSFEAMTSDKTAVNSNLVFSLYSHSNGSFWLANSQLHQFNFETQSFTRYNAGGSFSILGMIEDSQGNIWFGGDDGKLWGFDIDTKKVFHTVFEQPAPEGAVHAVSTMTHGVTKDSLWIGTNLGVYHFNARTFDLKFYRLPGELESGIDTIRDLVMAEDGKVWVASFEGLSILNPDTGEVKSIRYTPGSPSPLPTNNINSIILDSQGNLLVGTDKKGVVKFSPDGEVLDHIPASADEGANALPPGAVNVMLEDHLNNTWLAVGNYGVYRINPTLEKFRVLKRDFANANSLAFNNVLNLHEDTKGNIWIATDGGGLDRFDPANNQFTHYTHDAANPHSISSNSVISLSEDARGRIWAGTWAGGISIYDPLAKTFSHIKRNPSKPEGQRLAINNIFNITRAHNGSMWVSAWLKGLQIIEPYSGRFSTYLPHGYGQESGIVNSSIQAIEREHDQRYWIGGGSGLEFFNPDTEKFTPVYLENELQINDLFFDQDTQILWISSSNCLLLFDAAQLKPIRKISIEDGLSGSYVVSVTKDHAGIFWVATNAGLNRLDPSTLQIDVFDQRDGLAGSHFNRFSHLLTRDGLVYLGGKNGLTVFNPKRMPRNTIPPEVALLNLELNNKPVEAGQHTFVPKHISSLTTLQLPYQYRNFSIEFTALDFVAPSKNRYRYKLEGYADDWIDADSKRRQVHYANLPPGNYTFYVTAANSDGVWNHTGKQLPIQILAPWWMTWWARMLATALALAAVFMFSHWRNRVNLQRNSLLEMKVAEKTTELERANSNIMQLNHELEDRVQQRTEQLTIEINERRKAEAKFYHLAFHDSLTGLPNRAWLLKTLKELIQRTGEQSGETFGLMFIDGDRFKQVNDTHGHLVGDKLLVKMGERLCALANDTQTTVRLGGDEFTILFSSVPHTEAMIEHAEKILKDLERPFSLGKHQVFFKVSIGMVICDHHYRTPETVLQDADIAMYTAKQKGHGTWQLFDAHMREKTTALAEMEQDLQHALRHNQFHVVYQPIVHIATGELMGFEALLRWTHPSRGPIPPDQFIPLAEEIGLIVPLGQWVLNQACSTLEAWLQTYQFRTLPYMAVNISALQLNQLDFMESIEAILQSTGINSCQLKLELTESVIMENTSVVNRLMEALRIRQIDLAIDDFGTGYSSLRYLDELPVQILKLDKQFVDKVDGQRKDNDGTLEIIRATIALAHNLKLKVVAEGIETSEQYEFLAGLGCDYGQGYLISRPQTAKDLEGFITTKSIRKFTEIEPDKADDNPDDNPISNTAEPVRRPDRRNRR